MNDEIILSTTNYLVYVNGSIARLFDGREAVPRQFDRKRKRARVPARLIAGVTATSPVITLGDICDRFKLHLHCPREFHYYCNGPKWNIHKDIDGYYTWTVIKEIDRFHFLLIVPCWQTSTKILRTKFSNVSSFSPSNRKYISCFMLLHITVTC